MANIIFDISAKVTNGKSQLLIRFFDSRNFDMRAKSGIYINPELWDKTERTVINHKSRFVTQQSIDCAKAESQINELRAYIYDQFMAANSSHFNSDWLKMVVAQYYKPKVTGNKPLADFVDEYIEAKRLLEGTAKQYRVLQRHLRLFGAKHYVLYAGSIVLEDLHAFEYFIRCEIENPKDGKSVLEISQNTVNCKLRSLRALCNYCVLVGAAKHNPFDKYKIKHNVYGTPVWLTIAERDKIYHTHFDNPMLERQKDIFVFQCLIGCRVSDLLQLTPANITDDGFLQYIQHKLRSSHPITVRVPLTDTAREIVERYKGMQPDGRLLPFISSQNYNYNIKTILEKAGITRIVMVHNPKTLTNEPKRVCDIAASHLARRTFTANIFKLTKSERITSAFTGHAPGSVAFSRYTDIDDDMKRDVISGIDLQ